MYSRATVCIHDRKKVLTPERKMKIKVSSLCDVFSLSTVVRTLESVLGPYTRAVIRYTMLKQGLA